MHLFLAPNPCSAWFWFTITTTIGYGNTAPVSVGGRALVYTAGFMCILIFVGIQSKCGHVVTSIVDDFFVRLNAKLMNRVSARGLMIGANALSSLHLKKYFLHSCHLVIAITRPGLVACFGGLCTTCGWLPLQLKRWRGIWSDLGRSPCSEMRTGLRSCQQPLSDSEIFTWTMKLLRLKISAVLLSSSSLVLSF